MFILLLAVIRPLELKPISKQKAENIFVPVILPNRLLLCAVNLTALS
jgi:hypothetical protein